MINLALVLFARLVYPRPQDLETTPQTISTAGLPRSFWIYLRGAALVAAGFADYPLIAFHFSRSGTVGGDWIAIFYAIAMAVSGGFAAVRAALRPLRICRADRPEPDLGAVAPLVFLGGFSVALVGAAIWGLGIGVHESIIPAAVAPMVPLTRRASAFGLFTAGYGVFWFLGSSVIGVLYHLSVPAVIVFCVAAELPAIPLFVWVGRHSRMDRHP